MENTDDDNGKILIFPRKVIPYSVTKPRFRKVRESKLGGGPAAVFDLKEIVKGRIDAALGRPVAKDSLIPEEKNKILVFRRQVIPFPHPTREVPAEVSEELESENLAEVIDLEEEMAKDRIEAALDYSVEEIVERNLLSPADWERLMEIWKDLDR